MGAVLGVKQKVPSRREDLRKSASWSVNFGDTCRPHTELPSDAGRG